MSKSVYVEVSGDVIRWARERAGLSYEDFKKPGQIQSWEREEKKPTLKQLQELSSLLRVAIGNLLLYSPPEEKLSIQDFRTFKGEQIKSPSPELFDTIRDHQYRQDWYQEYAINAGYAELDFVGSASLRDDPQEVADSMKEELKFVFKRRRKPDEYLRSLRALAEDAGVLVFRNGIVEDSTNRVLDRKEFRGFALVDKYAPLIFINSNDFPNPQLFTFAHEMAHLYLGSEGVSNQLCKFDAKKTERWCNQVAAEFLVPEKTVRQLFLKDASLEDNLETLSMECSASGLVVLFRLSDLGVIPRDKARVKSLKMTNEYYSNSTKSDGAGGGGDFYTNKKSRLSKSFTKAVFNSARSGKTLRREAYRLLSTSSSSIFENLRSKTDV
ncbi:MAG: ImmA/IrrE family metallo-endopeptidase [Pirellulaceae bacterium]|nr:ImmA/IrrE family metallo-endopeptidase [Pirellulaceae bacterium]